MGSAHVFSLGVVILAAGRSRRMGQPKLLLPWGNTSILGHLLDVWRNLGCAEISVVLALDDGALSAELDRLNVPQENRVLNPAPDAGMFSSVQCAASWARARSLMTHYVVVLGDQPHLRGEALGKLLAFAAENEHCICQPSYQGHGRHPVVFPRPVFEQLADSHAPTLKDFLAGGKVSLLECDDPGLELDIDTPADYQKARALEGPAD